MGDINPVDTLTDLQDQIDTLRAASAEMMAAYQEYTRYLAYDVPERIQGFDATWERLEKAKSTLSKLLGENQ